MSIYEERFQHYFPGCNAGDKFAQLMRPCAEERFPGIECQSEVFWPHGVAENPRPDCVYPYQAAQILGTGVPWEYTHLDQQYAKGAAKATYMYVCRLFPDKDNPFAEAEKMDGFIIHRDGWQYVIPEYHTNPIVVVCDSTLNDELWEDHGIPIYVLQQVRLYMALIREHDVVGKYQLPGIYVVRVTGNTPADITFRWITADVAAENALLHVIDNMIARRISLGQPIVPEVNELPRRNWREIKEEKQSEAYVVEDDTIHAVIAEYMAIRSQRKTFEKKAKKLKEAADVIALKLANMIQNSERGVLEDQNNGVVYSVEHVPKAHKEIDIKPDHIRLFAPEYEYVITQSNGGGTVKIDVL